MRLFGGNEEALSQMSPKLKLFHKDKLIGTIENPMSDESAFVGDITLTQAADDYKELFAFFNDDEKRWAAEPPFSPEWLSNWFVEEENGKRKEIEVPVINAEGEIWWR